VNRGANVYHELVARFKPGGVRGGSVNRYQTD
jgi:hypothetical protein